MNIMSNLTDGKHTTCITGSTTGSVVFWNGKRYELPKSSASISITDDGIFLDGELWNPEDIPKTGPRPQIQVSVQTGPITGSISSTSGTITAVSVGGDVRTTSGKIVVQGNVAGDVESTSGDIAVEKDAQRNVKTVSGDVIVHGNIHGTVNTISGDVRRR